MKELLKTINRKNIIMYFIVKIIKLYLSIVFFTSKVELNIHEKAKNILKNKEICFLTLWHGRMIIFPKIMRRYGTFQVLTSLHNDGKYILMIDYISVGV